ncbi:MAG: glutamate--cysteine ligase [Acidimicrobiales bacterium]
MHIEFNGSPAPTLGVEVELELVDHETGELVSAAADILSELGQGHPEGEHPKAKHELFECTIEIITGICDTVAEARADLSATLAEVREAADRRGIDLLCSGTHPFSNWGDQKVSDDPRYHLLLEQMGWTAQRLQIFGVHYHVGVRHGERVLAIGNGLAGYIPHLLALSASSPYWESRDTGLASSRSKVFEALPTAGLPHSLKDWAEFERFMQTLISAGALSTIREVWWDIRPHPDFGTIELRMCDGLPTLREVAALAALSQCLVTWLDQRAEAGEELQPPSDWVLRQNKWRAARYGIEADLIVDLEGGTRPLPEAVTELVTALRPVAVTLGCADELEGVLTILDEGPSYVRQRTLLQNGGDLRGVVNQLVDDMADPR